MRRHAARHYVQAIRDGDEDAAGRIVATLVGLTWHSPAESRVRQLVESLEVSARVNPPPDPTPRRPVSRVDRVGFLARCTGRLTAVLPDRDGFGVILRELLDHLDTTTVNDDL